MKIPTLDQVENWLTDAQQLNPGPWVDHSRFAALAARNIAEQHRILDPNISYILGLIHDIGRRFGRTHMRHALDGYNFLAEQGYEEIARICLTHSFPYKDVRAVFGDWDCSKEELDFVQQYIEKIEYTQYDLLIQLCDALALPSGFCLMEKRMVEVALRYGTNEYTVKKWEATMRIKDSIEKELKKSIYSLLPGVIENTFDLCV